MSAAVLESRPLLSVLPNTAIANSPDNHESRHLSDVELHQKVRELLKGPTPIPEPGVPPSTIFSFDEIQDMRPGFKIVGGVPVPDFEKEGGTIFDANKNLGLYEYAKFTTVNGLPWQLDVNMNEIPHFQLRY